MVIGTLEQACSQDFFSTELKETLKSEARGADSGMGSRERGQPAPSPPVRGPRSAVIFPSRIQAELRQPNGFHPFQVFRVASPGSLMLFINDNNNDNDKRLGLTAQADQPDHKKIQYSKNKN